MMAQSSVEKITGQLVSINNNTPIAYALIKLIETERWTTTNKEGQFQFDIPKLTQFTLEVQCLGEQYFRKTYRTEEQLNTPIIIELLAQSYAMEEITVIAQQGQGISTTAIIDNAAIQHVQPTTLGDVMQLLPGGLIENPDLSEKQTISIREVNTDANSASGTAIIVDGAPMSNSADYQTYSTTLLKTEGRSVQNPTNSSAGDGIDLRQIATDNIASIEVIRGIPSVQYGNLTSGAVIVKTKSGYTPYKVKIKSDPRLKQVYVGKGIQLNKGAAMNANIEYTNAYNDLRSKYEGFNRLSGQVAYSRTFRPNDNPFSFNSKLSFYSTLDHEKTDPDALVAEEVLKSSELGSRLNIYGKWAINNRFITNLSYNTSLAIKEQEDYQRRFRSGNTASLSFAIQEGENEGIYLPSTSLTELTIKGLPIDLFAQFSANKNHSFIKGIINNILVGAEYRLSGNYGEGSLYDVSNPPRISSNTTRPRSYKEIPASESIALYLENKLTLPIKTTTLDLQAGMRISNFQPTGLTKGAIGIYYEPRINAHYKIIQNTKRLLQKLHLHAGIGLNYKAPSLMYQYPDKAYFDLISLDYYHENPDIALAYFSTHIFDSSNPDLKPAKNLKREVGIDFKIGTFSGEMTAFREDLSDGFGMLKRYHFIDYNVYDATGTPPDTKPDISTLTPSLSTYIISHSYPTNNKATEKLGIEYTFNFGKIESLSTDISMNGAWLKTTRRNSTSEVENLPDNDNGGQHPNIGVYPSNEGRVSERLNTTFRFITHSPRLRLVFTTTMQITWMDKYYNTPYDEVPLYLYNKDGDISPFTDDMRNDIAYKEYVKTKGSNYFSTESLPPLLLCNFKLSKEFSNTIKFSFYANNILNKRPIYQSKNTLQYIRRNPSIYFGAELIIKL